MADPLGRLSLDPSSVVGEFDGHLYGRVESRSVSLLLAAVPQSVRDDVVTNRWLTSASILFRVLCLFQPGGSSERSHLLSQLVNPDPCRSFSDAIKGLRRWQQGLQRAGEIHATLPDASLLLRGLDGATSSLLTAHPMIGFRVNAFRHQLAIDYNPTVANVVQLVRLIQAECEAASITSEGSVDKRARNAALNVAKDPPVAKSVPTPPPPPAASVAVVNAGKGEGKDKGSGKGKGEGTQQLCHKFSDASGCKFGDACIFKHDRARARKEGKCLACGQSGHIRPDCPIVAPENRVVLESGAEGSPKGSSSGGGKGRGKGKPAKAGAQAKGITEDTSQATVASAGAGGAGTPGVSSPEALVAEAAKILKGVSLKPLHLRDLDESWILSALTSASNPDYCLIDSGATNALRPAGEEELSGSRVIRVDLASGVTDLRINPHGTLLHVGPCQVILPANYLIELGFSITWKRKGCRIKHPKRGCLEVTVVKGCPLVPKEVGLALLSEYEERCAGVPVISKAEAQDLQEGPTKQGARVWLRDRLKARQGRGLTDVDQLVFLRGAFPELPMEVLGRVCVPNLKEGFTDWSELPWNRRFRRSISRSKPGEVLVSVAPNPHSWRGLGRVVAVSSTERGLGSRLVFQLLLRWAEGGIIRGLVQSELMSAEVWGGGESSVGSGCEQLNLGGLRDAEKGRLLEECVSVLRLLLLFSVSQAAKDCQESQGSEGQIKDGLKEADSGRPPMVSPMKDPHTGGRFRDVGRVFFVVAGWSSEDSGKWGIPRSVREFAELYEFYRADFDKGCFGSFGIGGMSLLSSSWYVYEAVHGVRLSPEVKRFWSWLDSNGVSPKKTGFGWPAELLRVVQNEWYSWCRLGCRTEEVAVRRALLAKLSKEEAYERHVAHDHVPYLKGCPVCIAAQGRQRCHWRSSFVGVHSVSFDIAGPFIPGRAYNVEASGRDKGEGYRYFLACAYTVPEGYSPVVATKKDWENEDYAPSEDECVGEPEPSVLFPELWDSEGDLEYGMKAVTHRVRSKRSEDDGLDPGESKDVEVPAATGNVAHDALGRVGHPGKEEGFPALKTKTLFMGAPLRTKKGKEVLLQVQGMINKLEAYGYPAQRFHADRAKELRSTALISWLKGRGVHVTWTPGDSPAGNRAELAVQNLKGMTRKLLFVAKLAPKFWPLALGHATERNWWQFGEALGQPQPVLLPFGSPVQARKRFQTGFQAQWQSRSVSAVYLGPAPSTPGGHLVLVTDKGEQKVLLTNTIYPVRGAEAGAVVKPKYRISGKRSRFAVKVVAAAEMTSNNAQCRDSSCGFAAGGESSLSFAASGPETGSRPHSGVSDLSSDEEGLQEDGFVGEGFLREEESEDEAPGVKEMWVASEETLAWIESLVLEGEWSAGECEEVLEKGLGRLPVATRPMLSGRGRAMVCGLYAVGGFKGITKASRMFPSVVRYLNQFLRSQVPDGTWTSLYISHNARAPMHRDLRNAPGFPVVVRSVGCHVGGGLWVESDQGPVLRTLPTGQRKAGHIFDIRKEAVCFTGESWHAPEEWEGTSRWVISGFVPRDLGGVVPEHWESLKGLGFPVGGVTDRLGSKSQLRALLNESENVENTYWEVDMPCWIVRKADLKAWVHWHEGATCLKRFIAEDVSECCGLSEMFELGIRQLQKAECECEWLEAVLRQCQAEEETYGSVKALQVDVPLGEGESGGDQFLQTRTIGLSEARKELSCWKEPALEEVTSLEVSNEAVTRVDAKQVDQWVEQGIAVIQLPGKCVLTRKSGTGRRRCRAVCCGNYLPAEKLGLSKEDLYASGAEGVTLRTALAFAARYEKWRGFTIDVKSAFLYAPIGAGATGKEERIVVKPPSFLTELGILKSTDRWWVKKALYGLPTSPKDWGNYRDQEFRALRLRCGSQVYGLVQSKADESLWFLREIIGEAYHEVVGLLVVYVDDLAVFAMEAVCNSFIGAVQEKWKTSSPTWFGVEPITFCGVEIVLTERGYRLNQSAYLQELLLRFGVEGTAPVPLNKWVEPEIPAQVDIGDVRAAQAITGALLWIATRSRPDISFSVSKMGQLATKAPKAASDLGMQVLAYLNSTSTLGIEFLFDAGSFLF